MQRLRGNQPFDLFKTSGLPRNRDEVIDVGIIGKSRDLIQQLTKRDLARVRKRRNEFRQAVVERKLRVFFQL